ncbi:Peptidase, M23/M37 family [Polaromonas sp. CG9_12]|nr:Peptidase, M23/M37 family [Polaromonas sp. CG9_12]
MAAAACMAWAAMATANGAGGKDNAAALQPSELTPPLEDMNVRWDGTEASGSGMKTFDSPRFGMVRDGGARAHTGVDLDAPVGTPIFAVADGVITLARYNDPMLGSDVLLMFRPTASMLTYLASVGSAAIDGVLFANYAHLSAVFVETGQRVARGTMIGRTGTSGNADQKYPHLHFEIRKTRFPGIGAAGLGNRIDPELMFKVDFSTPVEAVTRPK